jgi:hypothetical protein
VEESTVHERWITELAKSIDMNSNSDKKTRWPTILFVLLAIGSVVAAIWLVYWRPDRPTALSTTARRAIYLKVDLAIAELEGGDFTDEGDPLDGLERAIVMFEELKQKLPGELLPLRNLAIAHLLRFEVDADMQSARFESTRDAMETLLARPDDTRVAALLGARFLSKILPLDPDDRAGKIATGRTIVDSLAGRKPADGCWTVRRRDCLDLGTRVKAEPALTRPWPFVRTYDGPPRPSTGARRVLHSLTVSVDSLGQFRGTVGSDLVVVRILQSEGVGNPIEERKKCGHVHALGDLFL